MNPGEYNFLFSTKWHQEKAVVAYSDIDSLIEAPQETGLIQPAVRFRPWLTFKA
ncbi:hypothetical protein [Escherichia marmotae]|uniref:hypothetical protein n=1 Tax=Escherichia marmotae TaxID=1499973 RepID=UPI002F353A83